MPFDRIEDLRTFALVVDTGSFSAAARALQLTTNAVSRRIQHLEAQLGVRLLTRTTRRTSPTDEGRRLHARCARILAELDAADAELHPSGDPLQGTVRLALPPAATTRRLLAGLGALSVRHPRLAIQLRVTNQPVDLVATGVDLALHVGPVPASTLVARKLATSSWQLAAAPSYLARHGRPRTPADLAGHQCLRLLADRPQDEWRLLDRRGREVIAPVGGAFECDDSRVLGDAVYAGLGIGIRPDHELERAVADGLLEHVLPGYRFGTLDIHALVARGRLRLPRIAAFVELLRDVVAAA